MQPKTLEETAIVFLVCGFAGLFIGYLSSLRFLPEFGDPTEEQKEASNREDMQGIIVCVFFWFLGAVVFLIRSLLINDLEFALYSGILVTLILVIFYLGKYCEFL